MPIETTPLCIEDDSDYDDRELMTRMSDKRSRRLARQVDANLTYEYGDYTIWSHDNDKNVSPAEITSAMELEHVVKRAPRFGDQVKDATRTNKITARRYGSEEHDKILTEHEALVDLDEYLQLAEQAIFSPDEEGSPSDLSDLAKDMRENLTFIGEKELEEGTCGIATYWKFLLERDQDTQLFIVHGYVRRHHGKPRKSDDYMLDRILAHFTDDELKKWSPRLATRYDDISVTPDKLRTILLDDWIASGGQMHAVATALYEQDEELVPTLELHTVVASESRIKTGLRRERIGTKTDAIRDTLPMVSYYLANPSNEQVLRGVITGSHSSVDFGFSDALTLIAGCARDELKRTDMDDETRSQFERLARHPYLADVVRSYRQADVPLIQLQRLQDMRAQEPLPN